MTLADDYGAIRERAAVGEAVPVRALELTGSERAAYLHGLLTNDIQSLVPGAGCYAAWLTPQGRMHTDMHVFELGDMMLIAVPVEQARPTLERLDQLIFAEDVRVRARDDLAPVWVHGPAAAAALATALEPAHAIEALAEYRAARCRFDGADAIVLRLDQLGVPGFCTCVPADRSAPLRTALQRAGAVEAAPEAVEAARIEARYPRFGVDMTADTIPLEAGIEGRAISFTKGCYVGQEVIVRVLHRGHGRVARRLVGLRFESPVPPSPGVRLLADGRDVGFVTSAARSPARGSIALGYVHRDFVEAGTVLRAPPAAGGDTMTATVEGTASGTPAASTTAESNRA